MSIIHVPIDNNFFYSFKFQYGLYQDITVGLQNAKVLVICVSDEVSAIILVVQSTLY